MFDRLVEDRALIRECGICKATVLHIDVARTRFSTMEEARPALYACEADQIASAAWLREGKN